MSQGVFIIKIYAVTCKPPGTSTKLWTIQGKCCKWIISFHIPFKYKWPQGTVTCWAITWANFSSFFDFFALTAYVYNHFPNATTTPFFGAGGSAMPQKYQYELSSLYSLVGLLIWVQKRSKKPLMPLIQRRSNDLGRIWVPCDCRHWEIAFDFLRYLS